MPEQAVQAGWIKLGQALPVGWADAFTPINTKDADSAIAARDYATFAESDISSSAEMRFKDAKRKEYATTHSDWSQERIDHRVNLDWRIHAASVREAQAHRVLREAMQNKTVKDITNELLAQFAMPDIISEEPALEIRAEYAGDLETLHSMLHRIDLDCEKNDSSYRVLFRRDEDFPWSISPSKRADVAAADWSIGYRAFKNREFIPIGCINAWLLGNNRVDVRLVAFQTEYMEFLQPFYAEVVRAGNMRIGAEGDVEVVHAGNKGLGVQDERVSIGEPQTKRAGTTGSQISTEVKLAVLRRKRQAAINSGKPIPSFTKTCQLAGIDYATARKRAPELHKRWQDASYVEDEVD